MCRLDLASRYISAHSLCGSTVPHRARARRHVHTHTHTTLPMPHGARPTKYLHLHAVNQHGSLIELSKCATTRQPTEASTSTCTCSSSTGVSSPRSSVGACSAECRDLHSPSHCVGAEASSTRRVVLPTAVPDGLLDALRFCDDLLGMDDAEFTMTVILTTRCLDTGMPVCAANCRLFALIAAVLACKQLCDETYTLAQIAKASGFAFEMLRDGEWFVMGWLLDNSRLSITLEEYQERAAKLFNTHTPPPPPRSMPPPPIVPITWVTGSRVGVRPRPASAPAVTMTAQSHAKGLRALSARFMEGLGWDSSTKAPPVW